MKCILIALLAALLFAIAAPLVAPDMEIVTTHKEEIFYEITRDSLVAGTRLRIVVNDDNVIFDRTVPQGKKVVYAALTITGTVVDE